MRNFILTLLVLVPFFNLLAHEGGLDSSSGHNCNVGSCQGTYHYHFGGSWAPISSSSSSSSGSTSWNCPDNSVEGSKFGECICDNGYRMNQNNSSCLKNPEAPENGHLTERGFACNEGYRRIFDRCDKLPDKAVETKDAPVETVKTEVSLFSDLSTANKNYDAISYMKKEGIVKGYKDGSFRHDNKINRAEFTKIIIAAEFSQSKLEDCMLTAPFSDVSVNDWFFPYVCLAKNEGIINGYPDGTFGPGKDIAFTEAAKIILETLNEKVEPDAIWYKPYVERLGNLKAIPEDFAALGENVTRGQMAELLFRLKTKPNKASKRYSDFVSKKEAPQVEKETVAVIVKKETSKIDKDTLSLSEQYSEIFEKRLKSLTDYIGAQRQETIEDTTLHNGDEYLNIDAFFGDPRYDYRDGELMGIWQLADLNVPYRVGSSYYLKGYRCTDDCSGHIAGFNWALENEIEDCSELSFDTPNSFKEGCQSYQDRVEDELFAKYASCNGFSSYNLDEGFCQCDFGYVRPNGIDNNITACVEVTRMKSTTACKPYMSLTENGFGCYHAPDDPGWNDCTLDNSGDHQNIYLRWLSMKTTPLTNDQHQYAVRMMAKENYDKGMACYNAKFK